MTSPIVAAGIESAISAALDHTWSFIKDHVDTAPISVTPARSRRPIRADTTLKEIIKTTATNVSRNLSSSQNPSTKELKALLVSPEVETLLRQVFAVTIVGGGEATKLSDLHGKFHRIVRHFIGDESAVPDEGIDSLYEGLLASCARILDVALTRGSLVALDAKATGRYRLLQDELEALKLGVYALQERAPTDADAVLEFEKKYRRETGNRHGHIVPPHLSEHDRVPLDDLFVAPALQYRKTHEEGGIPPDQTESVSLSQFLNAAYRSVILGTPGGGKSTLASKVSFDLSTKYSQRLYGGRQVTPVLVVVRDYGADNKESKYSIIGHISATASATYQLQPPDGAFEYLLSAGRLLVIFDGLDELLDTSFRRKVTQDIESFCRQFPAVPVIVTAREVGYEEAPLDRRLFDEFRLAPFSTDQVREYAQKWFSLNKNDSPDKRRDKTKAFLSESASAPDLRSNPLLLGLMCNIYREETYIPKNRPEIYRKCAEMLFDRWDRHRAIPVLLRYDLQLRPVLAHIAHWLYSSQITTGVTEQQLVAQAASYHAPKIDDRDQAEAMAREFVEFARGRAWVFTDQGTTPSGERLYQFTHRTFLEYFTALYIVRKYESTDELMDTLIPHIERHEWGVVPQLACHIRSLDSDVAGDRILIRALDAADHASVGEAWHLVLFAAQCLRFIVPEAAVTRRVTAAATHCALEMAISRVSLDQEKKEFGTDPRGEIMPQVLGIADERLPLIADTLKSVTQSALAVDDPTAQRAALEFGLHLDSGVRLNRGAVATKDDLHTYWKKVSDEFGDLNKVKLLEVADLDFDLARDAFWRGLISPVDLIEKHGAEALFFGRPYAAFPGLALIPPSRLLVDKLLTAPQFPGFACLQIDVAYSISTIGAFLATLPTPWLSSAPPSIAPVARSVTKPARLASDLEPSVVFGAFVLAATHAELVASKQADGIHPPRGYLVSSGPLVTVLRGRYLGRLRTSFERALETLSFNDEQQSFAMRWARGELSTLGSSKVSLPPKAS